MFSTLDNKYQRLTVYDIAQIQVYDTCVMGGTDKSSRAARGLFMRLEHASHDYSKWSASAQNESQHVYTQTLFFMISFSTILHAKQNSLAVKSARPIRSSNVISD